MSVRFDDDLNEEELNLNSDDKKNKTVAKIIENSMSGIVNITVNANNCDNPQSKKFYKNNQIFISQPSNMDIEITA